MGERASPRRTPAVMRALFALVLLVVAAVGLSFGVENGHPVTFRYYVGEARVSLSLLLVLTATMGVLLGVSAGLGALLSVGRENRRLRRRLAAAQAATRDAKLERVGDSV